MTQASSTGGRSERGSRRQRHLLVLGTEDDLDRLSQFTDRPLTRARSAFDVVGEITTARLSNAPEAVIVCLPSITTDPKNLVVCIRRVDPLPVVAWVGNEDLADAACRAGFDAMVTPKTSADEFEDAVLGLTSPISAPARNESESSPDAATASTAPSPRAHTEPLGDVDLVQAITHQSSDVPAIAARIIEQETGWKRVSIIAPSASGDASCRCIQVRCANSQEVLALLCVEKHSIADASELVAWAHWLAPWLRLAQDHAAIRRQAFTDQLTGACNRRQFDSKLPALLRDARERRQCVSLLLFDIDDFKLYNDRYGHAAGDEILVETVRLLTSVIRPHDHVCRIGGDEFVVIFHDPEGKRDLDSDHPRDIRDIARRFQEQIASHRFPKLGNEAPGSLTISGGIATYPWDGPDAQSLLEHADQNLLASKRAGKNAITVGRSGERRTDR